MYHKGLKQYRFKNNPEERRFAEAWEKQNNPADSQADSSLAYLLSPDSQKESVSDRDREVAATTIQWLGSPVGQAFLRDLGYERKPSV